MSRRRFEVSRGLGRTLTREGHGDRHKHCRRRRRRFKQAKAWHPESAIPLPTNCTSCTDAVPDQWEFEFGASDWSWTAPTTKTCTVSGLTLLSSELPSPLIWTCDIEHEWRAIDVAGFNGTHTMYHTQAAIGAPDSCGWHWASGSVDNWQGYQGYAVGSGAPGSACSPGATYIGTSSIAEDTAVPIRLMRTINMGTLSGCGTPDYDAYLPYYLHARLERVDAVQVASDEWSQLPQDGSRTPHWKLICEWRVFSYQGAIATSTGSVGSPSHTGHANTLSGVGVPNVTIGGLGRSPAYDQTDTTSNGSTCPPHRYATTDGSNTQWFPHGSRVFFYKEIECNDDLDGTDITLTRDQSTQSAQILSDWAVTAPTTVTLRTI